MDRFFCPTLTLSTSVTLDGDEFHHLAHVLRAKPGLKVELFDGRGASSTAVIERIGKRDAQLLLEGPVQNDEPASAGLTLAVACPKGERLKWLIEKLTELDVARFVPLLCQRSVVEPRDTRLAKLQQTVVAACKQSRRNRLMEISEPTELQEFLHTTPASVMIAHPTGRPLQAALADMTRGVGDASPIVAAIGPEGGFTDDEISLAKESGAQLVSLGRRILRSETAAMALAAAFLFDPASAS
jgi:16S rRNA (uracil1498-N3)-methyltransferase